MKARIVALAALAFAALAGPLAAQENWPERPITLVIPYAAGGGADFVARLLADGISEELGESVVVESGRAVVG